MVGLGWYKVSQIGGAIQNKTKITGLSAGEGAREPTVCILKREHVITVYKYHRGKSTKWKRKLYDSDRWPNFPFQGETEPK